MPARVTWMPPDGGWGWVIVLCSMVLHAQSFGLLLSLGEMYVSWLEAFGDSRGATSWVFSIAISVTALFAPLPAALANLYGFRVVTVAGGLLTSIGFIFSYFATSVTFLVISIGLISGIGCCFLYLSAVAIVSVYFTNKRSVAMGIGTSGVGIGVLILGPMFNYLINTYGWREALLIMGAVQLHACVFGLLIRPLEKIIVEWDEEENEDRDFIQENKLYDKNVIPAPHIEETDDFVLLPNQSKESIHEPTPTQSTGSMKTSKASLQKSTEFLLSPHLMSSAYLPNQQKANSMMKINNGSLLSVNKTKEYRSLRSLNHNGFLRSDLIDESKFHHKSQHSTDAILARSIKYLGSISLLGSLPNNLVENIEYVKERDCKETKTTHHLALENTERDCTCAENKGWNSTFKKKLKEAIQHNIEMLRFLPFIQFAISNFAASIASAAPVVYLVDRAMDSGMEKTSGAMLIALNGIGNIFGRVFFGAITYWLVKDYLMTYIAVLTSVGVFTALSPLCGSSFVLHAIYAALFGILQGGYFALVAVTIVDIMGLEKGSASFGLLLVFTGCATLLGPPIGGLLFDWTRSYTLTYVIYGISLGLSALIVLPLACSRRRRKKREEMIKMYEDEREVEEEVEEKEQE